MDISFYKALYSYNGDFPGSLPFKPNELFLVLRKENEYWFLVSSKNGTLGCVPINYLEKTESSKTEMKSIISKAIDALSSKSASIIKNRDAIIKNLMDSNDGIDNGVSVGSFHEKVKIEQSNKNEAPNEPSIVPNGLAFKLTDIIRQTTNSSHTSSLKALRNILNILDSHIPEMRLWTNSIQSQIKDSSKYNLKEAFYKSMDWKNLEHLFTYFQQRKNDSQERGWSLHENVNELRGKLIKLLKILKMSNKQLVSNYLETTNYESFISMMEWYQLEQRSCLRGLLLQIFIVCCEINRTSSEVCLQSVLPLELIRDILDKHTESNNFTHATLLLNILISSSKTINLEVREKLNETFCDYLLTKLSNHHLSLLDESDSSNHVVVANDNNHAHDDDDEDEDEDDIDNGVNGRWSEDQHDDDDGGDHQHNNGRNSSSYHRNSGIGPSSEWKKKMYSLKSRIYMDDVIFACLLSLNKLFVDIKLNPVIKSLVNNSDGAAQLFVEKLIRAFNRNFDPSVTSTFICDTKETLNEEDERYKKENGVRKFLCDVYSSRTISELIYCADTDVIIDIISRQICDLSPNSQELSEYLLLLDLIITNSDYESRGSYKMNDLQQAISIFLQSGEDESNKFDRELAITISNKLDSIV